MAARWVQGRSRYTGMARSSAQELILKHIRNGCTLLHFPRLITPTANATKQRREPLGDVGMGHPSVPKQNRKPLGDIRMGEDTYITIEQMPNNAMVPRKHRQELGSGINNFFETFIPRYWINYFVISELILYLGASM